MDFAAIALTVVAGLAMGAINNIAGGAGVLGLLAFEYGFGLPLQTANPSTRLAAVAVGCFAFLGFLRAGQKIPKAALTQAVIALPGALCGAYLALDLPDLIFRSYLAFVMVLLLWQQLRGIPSNPRPASSWARAFGCFMIGLHMGYVQVGTGLMATLVLARAYDRDLLAVNAAKSIVVLITATPSATHATGSTRHAAGRNGAAHLSAPDACRAGGWSSASSACHTRQAAEEGSCCHMRQARAEAAVPI